MTDDAIRPHDAGETAAPRLRVARQADAKLLFDWVNRPDSLAVKFDTQGPIPWETHAAWLAARLVDPDTGLWIIEQQGQPVGQVRFERREAGLEVDIFVTPEARGRGVALRMLAAAARSCAGRWPGLPLVARIKTGNVASERLFAAAGFVLAERRDDHAVYLLARAG